MDWRNTVHCVGDEPHQNSHSQDPAGLWMQKPHTTMEEKQKIALNPVFERQIDTSNIK